MRKIFVISALGLMMSVSYTKASEDKVPETPPVTKDVATQTEQKKDADLKGAETSTHPIQITPKKDTETHEVVRTEVPAGSPAQSRVIEKKEIAPRTEAATSDDTASELQAANEKVEALTAQKKEADLKVQELNAQRTKIVQDKDAEIRKITLDAQRRIVELEQVRSEAMIDQARLQKELTTAKADITLAMRKMADLGKQQKAKAALDAAQLRAAQLKK